MRTIVYVDGFNLYYGCVKGTPYRWLNLLELCRLLLGSAHHVTRVKYFTANVSGRPGDPDQPIRQQVYLRALRTLPEIEIYFGHFLSHAKWMPAAVSLGGVPAKVQVIVTEEKGSDVNLATQLVSDAYERAFEAAVLITNDSDLVAPIALVRNRLGLPVGVLNPHKRPSVELNHAASFIKPIRRGVLQASQFPSPLRDAGGEFHKPASW